MQSIWLLLGPNSDLNLCVLLAATLDGRKSAGFSPEEKMHVAPSEEGPVHLPERNQALDDLTPERKTTQSEVDRSVILPTPKQVEDSYRAWEKGPEALLEWVKANRKRSD